MEGFNALGPFHASVDASDDAQDLTSVFPYDRREFRGSMGLAIEHASNQIMLQVIPQVRA